MFVRTVKSGKNTYVQLAHNTWDPLRKRSTSRAVFSLVANRALAPSSKFAAAEWMNHDVFIPGPAGAAGQVEEEACYRAMDWLHDVEATFAKRVYYQVTDLLNLEVDVLFFDTTSTSFETETADEPVWRDDHGHAVTGDEGDGICGGEGGVPGGAVKAVRFRTWGESKDSREDLPQVIIGMAVTREGIPVRVWSWPGNTSDSALIGQVRADRGCQGFCVSGLVSV
ncbi:MAG: hypothetical protein LKI58_10615 [Actinomyces sp.]|jgi:hypothetical protein|nr:hypothetical protein [Actinomyces sp.]MCI1642425.1 hypothetical protein [Actinomyces sp.]MCI1788490.1 hypothetical protein [Actinomyces sp.]